MGYYTYYELEILDENLNEVFEGEDLYNEVLDLFSKISGYDTPFDESCKWYEQDDDTKEISKHFPDLYICIYGDGEESNDQWKTIYKNGEIYTEWHLDVVIPTNEELIKSKK